MVVLELRDIPSISTSCLILDTIKSNVAKFVNSQYMHEFDLLST
jgi:hypothetical protein